MSWPCSLFEIFDELLALPSQVDALEDKASDHGEGEEEEVYPTADFYGEGEAAAEAPYEVEAVEHLVAEKSSTSQFTSASRGQQPNLGNLKMGSGERRREVFLAKSRLNLWQSIAGKTYCRTSRTSLRPNAKRRYFGRSIRRSSTQFNKRSRLHDDKKRW